MRCWHTYVSFVETALACSSYLTTLSIDKIIRDRMDMSKRNYWDDCETGGAKMDRVLLCPPEFSHAFSWLCILQAHT